jgi:uncharacterized membrane protein YkvA (DUF1232 family)
MGSRPPKRGVWPRAVRTFSFILSPEAGPGPKALALIALLYLLWPLDLLPGLPPLSWLDDAAVAWLAYHYLGGLMERHETAGTSRRKDDAVDTTARIKNEEEG